MALTKDMRQSRVARAGDAGVAPGRLAAGAMARRAAKAETARRCARLDGLEVPAATVSKPLKGDRSGRHSIRVNDQYRITCRWESGHAYEVDVEVYHQRRELARPGYSPRRAATRGGP